KGGEMSMKRHRKAGRLIAAGCILAVLFGAIRVAGAASPSPDPPARDEPVVVPQSPSQEEDGGALARLEASRAASDQTAPPDLAARVLAETQRLDLNYPTQAPGATPPAGVSAWSQIGPTNVIHERVQGYFGPIQIKSGENG